VAKPQVYRKGKHSYLKQGHYREVRSVHDGTPAEEIPEALAEGSYANDFRLESRGEDLHLFFASHGPGAQHAGAHTHIRMDIRHARRLANALEQALGSE
jgi:hypothetical protein